MLRDAAGNLLGWESALFRTLRGLAHDPALVVEDYAAGRRRRYVPPARLCLLALAGWLLVARMVDQDPLKMSGFGFGASNESAGESVERIRGFLLKYLEVLLYLALPLRALLLQLFFRRSGRNLAECLVLVLYVAGFSYLLGIAAAPLQAFGVPGLGPVRVGISFLWTLRTAHGFFRRGWLDCLWRAALVGILHTLATGLLFALIVLVWLLLTKA